MPRATGATETGTRERLIEAAAELIGEGGCGAASVGALTHRAGLTPGALYRHFPSKSELLVEVLRSLAHAELDAMRAAADGETDAAERLDAVISSYVRRALARPRLAWALIYEPVDPPVDVERLVFRRTYRDGMAELLRAGIKAGRFTAEDPELIAAAIIGVISETLLGPLSPLGESPPEREHILRAILTLCRGLAGCEVHT